MQKPGGGGPAVHTPMSNLKSPNSLYTQRLAMTKPAPESTQKMPRRIRLTTLTTTLLLAFTPFFAAAAQEHAQEKETKRRAASPHLFHFLHPHRHQRLLAAPHLLHLQRRPRLRFRLAAHGRLRTAPRRHRQR